MMRRSAYLATVVTLTLLSGIASAQAPEASGAPTDPAVEQARTHFQQGAALYKEGNFDAALAEFTRAMELAPNYRILYNIGQVHVERHDYVAARLALEEYLRLGKDEISAERREQVERDVANLATRISQLRVSTNVEGAELSVDGVRIGTLPLSAPLFVSAGMRRLIVSKRGYSTVERVISVAGGDESEIAVQLEPIQALPEQSGKISSSSLPVSGRTPGTAAWVSLAATGVFASGAVVFAVLADGKNDDLDDELSRFPADRSRVDDTRSQLKLYAGMTDGLAVAAGISAAFTTYFFFFAGPDRAEEKPAPRKAAARLVPLAPGLAVIGDF